MTNEMKSEGPECEKFDIIIISKMWAEPPDKLNTILVERIAMNDTCSVQKALQANQKFLTLQNYNILDTTQVQLNIIKDLPRRGLSLMHIAAFYDSLECLMYLQKEGLKIDTLNAEGYTPLMYACVNGSFECVVYLLNQKADYKLVPMTKQNHNIIYLTVAAGNPKLLEYIFDFGVTYDSTKSSSGESPMGRAIAIKNMEIIYLLLSRTYKTSTFKEGVLSPLMQAITNYVDEAIEPLLNSGADVNFVNSKGYTALLIAARRNSLPIVETLIKYGASVNCSDAQSGSTPVHFACDKGNLEMLQLLDQNGANLFATDRKQRFATFNTINAPNSDNIIPLLSYLHERGLDLNAKDVDGNTVLLELMPDSKKAKPEVIEFLLSNGAQGDVKNDTGKTPYMLAKAFKDPAVIEIFEKYMKKE